MQRVMPEIGRYWKARARELTSPVLDPDVLAAWEESPPEDPLLAEEDLTVMVKDSPDGTAQLWAWTVAEYRRAYVRLEASGRWNGKGFTDVAIAGFAGDEAFAINGGVDKQEALESEGFEIRLDPGMEEDD
jgi:hypothetical protein